MKSKLITMAVVAVVLGGIVFVNQYEPRRMAEAQYEAELKVAKEIKSAEEAELANIKDDSQENNNERMKEATANALKTYEERMAAEAKVNAENDRLLAEHNDYRVTFDCSHGEIVLEVIVELAPLGAVQFRKAVEDGVYDGARFFRVIPGFVAQFGIPGDPKKVAKWDKMVIKDDPVKASNTRGTISFATSGPDSRTTQVFINFGNNDGTGKFPNLDPMGFAPFGRVIKGMDVVDSIFAGYRDKPYQPDIERMGNVYLESKFPDLDYIKKATIQEIPAAAEEGGSDDVETEDAA